MLKVHEADAPAALSVTVISAGVSPTVSTTELFAGPEVIAITKVELQLEVATKFV